MEDAEVYLFCALFFVLGFCLAYSLVYGWWRKAVDEGRMMLKQEDGWKGTPNAACEIMDQYLSMFKSVQPGQPGTKKGDN